MRPQRLVQDLTAITDPAMRVAALVQALEQGDAQAWIAAIAEVADLAHDRSAPPERALDAARALESITRAAGSAGLSYASRQRLYQAALAASRPELARLYFHASPPSADPRLVARQTVPERALERQGRPLTLGERRALARTHRRDRLALIARDPHPAVIAVLLGNPSVTEPELVTIAASRHAVPEALGLIAEHPKWAARHAVKRALVLNPATPLAASLRLAATMPSQDLLEISRLSILSATLREHARQLLERRAHRPSALTPLS